MNIGLAGTGALAAFVSRRLAGKYSVFFVDIAHGDSSPALRVERLDSLAALGERSDVVLLAADSETQLDELLSQNGLLAGLHEGKIVANLGQDDPDRARERAVNLAGRGIAFVDASLHTENTESIHEASAILFGGAPTAFQYLHTVLETICPTIVQCGDAGDGHATRLVVAAIAACNRLITYECAAMGVSNGLTIGDMATVLNKSSGYNSASARVLPALASTGHTADATLGDFASDVKLASAVGMRYGAPMLIATLVRSMLDAACNRLGNSVSIDELASVWEADARLPVPRRL